MISLGSMLSGMIATIILSFYGYFSIACSKRPIFRDLRVLVVLMFIAGARMILPINLPINLTINSEKILPPIAQIAYFNVGTSGFSILLVFLVLSTFIGLLLIIKKFFEYRTLKNSLLSFTTIASELEPYVVSYNSAHKFRQVSLRYITSKESPFVIGLLNPMIIIPENTYDESDFRLIVEHELIHIKQLDLHLKFAFELLSSLFWWNPLMALIRNEINTALEISNDLLLCSNLTEQERVDFAALLHKTAKLNPCSSRDYVLPLMPRNKPLIHKRITNILEFETTKKISGLFLLHLIFLIAITASSFLITLEPFSISPECARDTFSLDNQTIRDDSYVLDRGDHYELYIEDEFVGTFQQYTGEFKNFPIRRKEKS